MKFTVTPTICGDSIQLETRTTMEGFADQVAHAVTNTKEEAVRAGLIALGWTPPPEKKSAVIGTGTLASASASA